MIIQDVELEKSGTNFIEWRIKFTFKDGKWADIWIHQDMTIRQVYFQLSDFVDKIVGMGWDY